MTASDDGSRDDPPPGRQDPRIDPELPELPFDEEAAWREIVENYGERPTFGGGGSEADTTGLSPFDRSYLDALDARLRPLDDRADRSARRPLDGPGEELPDPTDHFVPPEPPPIPRGTPARRLAWAGLLGSPVVLLLAVFVHMLTGWVVPTLLTLGVAAAFVGGFVFLVATMPRDRGDDWDDGAVL